jgi:hypothetical protein
MQRFSLKVKGVFASGILAGNLREGHYREELIEQVGRIKK